MGIENKGGEIAFRKSKAMNNRRLNKLIADVSWHGGEVTFRDLKKSHGFSDSEIRRLVNQSNNTLAITWAQNPAGGRRSERVVFN